MSALLNWFELVYGWFTINIWKMVLTKAIWANKKWAGFWQISQYINYSNKRGLHDYQFWKILPSTFNDFITKVSYVIVEPNEDFSHGNFEL